MADTHRRMLRLLSLLQTGRTWSVSGLADRLEIAERSVRRDVARLRDLGYPIATVHGPGGGYLLGPGAAMPPLLLDDLEAVAVALGLRLSSHAAVADLEEAAQRAMRKVEQVLPRRLAAQVRHVLAGVEAPAASAADTTADHLAAIGLAVDQRRVLNVRHPGAPWRRVEPHRAVLRGRRWYLVAWDLDSEAWTVFRLDRLEAVEVSVNATTSGPRELPGGSVDAFLDAHVPRRLLEATVRFAAEPHEVAQRLSRIDGDLVPDGPRHSLYRARVDSHEWLVSVLLVSGLDFAILEPPDLVAYTQAAARRLSDASDAHTAARVRPASPHR